MHVLEGQRSILESKPSLCICSCHLTYGKQKENGTYDGLACPSLLLLVCAESPAPRHTVLTQTVEAPSKLGLKQNPNPMLDTSIYRA